MSSAHRGRSHRLFAYPRREDVKPANNTYSWYLRLRGGQIVEAIAFFDTIELTDFWERITP